MSGRYTAHGRFQILLGGKSVYMTQILQKEPAYRMMLLHNGPAVLLCRKQLSS